MKYIESTASNILIQIWVSSNDFKSNFSEKPVIVYYEQKLYTKLTNSFFLSSLQPPSISCFVICFGSWFVHCISYQASVKVIYYHERKYLKHFFLKTSFLQLWPLECHTSAQNWAFETIFFQNTPRSLFYAMQFCIWFLRSHHNFFTIASNFRFIYLVLPSNSY